MQYLCVYILRIKARDPVDYMCLLLEQELQLLLPLCFAF